MASSSHTKGRKSRRAPNGLSDADTQTTANQRNVLQHPPQAPHYQTHYIPVESPPTPAPSPPLIAATLPAIQTNGQLSTSPASLANFRDPVIRRQKILSFLNGCDPAELLFISETVSPLLKRDFVSDLPPELVLHILSFVDEPKVLTRASRVSRNWYRIVRDEVVWRRMCYVHGFDDWDEAEVEALLEKDHARRKKEEEQASTRAEGERDKSTRKSYHRQSDTFSFRRYFKRSYITRTRWREGGELLGIHRIPSVNPDNGTVTSLALDSDWVVVGLANSMIKVFSAQTGVLCKTLVGHESGVWGVCLVSKGGHRKRPPAEDSSSGKVERSHPWAWSNGYARKKKKEKEFQRADKEDVSSRPSLDLSKPFTALNLDKAFHGTHVMPDESLEHLVPPPLQKALGFDLLNVTDSSETDRHTSGRSSEGVSDEYVLPGRQDPLRRDYNPNHGRSRNKGKHRADVDAEENRDAEELSTHASRITMSSSSRGWGQPNSVIVSGGCDKVLRVWDAQSGQCIYILHGHEATIRCIRVLDNRPIAVTGSRDASLRIWNIQLGRCLRILEGHDRSVRCVDVCGNKVVSGSYDTTCRIWDIDTGECLHVLRGHFSEVYCVAFDGGLIASGGLDTTVRVWDLATGQCFALLQGHTALVCQLQLSYANNILVTGGSDGRVITFSLSTYEPLHRLAAHDSSVTALQFDKNFLVTGGNDGRVRLYETQTGNFVREMSDPSESVWQVAFIKEVCAVMCKRGGRTVVEIWNLGPSNRKKRKKAEEIAARGKAAVLPGNSSRSS